jgi:D-3-phosphoglycerate dehydrogenase
MLSDLILITDIDLPGTDADDALTRAGHAVIHGSDPEARVRAGEVTALMVQWSPITADVMDSMPKLRFISRLGIGCDMIDIDAATERGIFVANTPAYCTEEVASHTIAMILTMTRGLTKYDRSVQAGKWSPVTVPPRAGRPSSMTVSVVGFGRIGSIVASGCRSLGYTVVVSDPLVPAERVLAAGHEVASLEEAVARADLLTLHAPLTAETRHMLDAEALGTMKAGSIVINTCRGALIDENALAEALRSGHLGGAALDVFEIEPLPFDSGLRGIDNVMLTPHASWYSPESLVDLPRHAAANIVDFLAGHPVPSVLNS